MKSPNVERLLEIAAYQGYLATMVGSPEVIRKYEGNSYDVAFLQRPGLWICSDDELEEFK
jgi:hypothetical protein